jgi:hypothetical protein
MFGIPEGPNFCGAQVALRMALGALRTQVVRQFLSKGLRVSILALMTVLALAAAAGRLLSGMLFGVSATDPATLGTVVAIVLAVDAIGVVVSGHSCCPAGTNADGFERNDQTAAGGV